MKSCVIPFTNLINETRNRPAQATNIDSHSPKASLSFDEQMAKIERLADMKEEGMLTDEEFQQQKQRILNG